MNANYNHWNEYKTTAITTAARQQPDYQQQIVHDETIDLRLWINEWTDEQNRAKAKSNFHNRLDGPNGKRTIDRAPNEISNGTKTLMYIIRVFVSFV